MTLHDEFQREFHRATKVAALLTSLQILVATACVVGFILMGDNASPIWLLGALIGLGGAAFNWSLRPRRKDWQ